MSKFTPGPWQIRSKLHDDWGVIRSASGDLVAKAGGWPYPTEEELSGHRKRGTDPYQANANLISAAPEMYEALKTVLVPLEIQFDLHQRMCKQHGIDITQSNACKVAKGRLDVVKTALAKADGK